jgi:para-aminobenzoate synthetase/4-amino-4-deoxychorismate lyase
MRLAADFGIDPGEFFFHIAQRQNKYAAYVDTGRHVICSASPELFFDLDGDIISGRPMKGTSKRGRTKAEDKVQEKWLRGDLKNRAENVMIVDMIRNDVGRIAAAGSVHVPELYTIEKYPTLFQMTSTVRGKTSASLTEIFSALYPCASITGTPKVSTMNIIAELETTPRKIYTGSIGFISPERKAQFNVAIRTALIDRQTGQAEYGVGGGVVWDSSGDDEYNEALLKARVLNERQNEFSLIETMRWTREEGYFLRKKHIRRLSDSAEYFGFTFSKKGLKDLLDEMALAFSSPQRVRISLDHSGEHTVEAQELLQAETQTFKVCLAEKPVSASNVFLFHKTTRREDYDEARQTCRHCDDVLLFNEKEELTEFTIGNLVVARKGELFTPPITCGLLAGTFREYLLESGQVTERAISIKELGNCGKIFLVNSVRKWIAVELVSRI